MRADISKLLGIRNNTRPEKYLGVGIEFSRAKSANFAGLKEKIFTRASSWKGRLLNQEGRGVLIKAVLQAILTHQKSCFKLPKKILDDINNIAANLWWGSQAEPSKLNRCNWKKIIWW